MVVMPTMVAAGFSNTETSNIGIQTQQEQLVEECIASIREPCTRILEEESKENCSSFELSQSTKYPSRGPVTESNRRGLNKRRKISRDEALMILLRMNSSLTRVPSCLNYLMEDRIEAHKLAGIKTANDLARLSFTLSRPHLISSTTNLIRRNFINVSDAQTNSSDSITIMQWNVLSQGYHCDKFNTCPQEDILWSSRKWKIIHEVAQYSPDIICLQEIDRFYFVHKMLQKIGFDGKFCPKPDSPCYHLPDNTGPDGCAIFYNTNKYSLIKTTTRVLQVCKTASNQVALLCTFKCKATGRTFCVCTTHLKARKSDVLAKLRDEQGKDLLNFVEEESDCNPIVITGDFNAESHEPVYKTMTQSLSSAYDEVQKLKCNSFHSNWTRRVNEEETKQTVDYVFYEEQKMKVTSLLNLSCEDLIAPVPNHQYPSDHLSLVVKFNFLQS